ncbi:hypothetical protein F8388_012747, partial [Cannabis sativa]
SFFQLDPHEDSFEISQQVFRVHDLIHNLACSITQNECSIVNSNDDREISDTVRYLRVVINENNLKKLSKLKKLKSIHIEDTGDEKDEVVQSLPHDLINCTTLRSLFIVVCGKLNLASEFINKDVQLSLHTFDCPKLLSLPDGMEGLTSLTHLEIEDCDALQEACKKKVGPNWHKIAHVPNRI